MPPPSDDSVTPASVLQSTYGNAPVPKAGQTIQPVDVQGGISNTRQQIANTAADAVGANDIAKMVSGEVPWTTAIAGMVPMALGGPEGKAAEAATEAGAEAAAPTLASVIKAYHGSPYDFNQFDLSKIGTGEGAQAYGHGLYFAENEGTAKAYRDSLSDLKPSQVEGTDSELPSWVAKTIASKNPVAIDDMKNTFAGRIQQMQKGIDDGTDLQPWVTQGNIDGLHKIMNGLDAVGQGANLKSPGKMYEVNINADPSHFLDWDKPLSEQSAAILSIAQQHGLDTSAPVDQPLSWLSRAMEVDTPQKPATGADLMRHLSGSRGQGMFDPEEVDPVSAAEKMRDAGIPGIKYLDQGSRGRPASMLDPQITAYQNRLSTDQTLSPSERNQIQGSLDDLQKEKAAVAKGTSNYVVFNDKLIDIIKKYGLAALLGGGAAANAPSSQDQTVAQ